MLDAPAQAAAGHVAVGAQLDDEGAAGREAGAGASLFTDGCHGRIVRSGGGGNPDGLL